MTRTEWIAQYDATKQKFEWFIKDYFIPIVKELETARTNKDTTRMMSLLNSVWFELPEGRFNIMANPKGWSEFINLLENPPCEES